MNVAQKLVIAAIGISALCMFLWPPFYVRLPSGVVTNLGYSFVTDPPRLSTIVALIHVPTLLVQLLGLFVVGSAAWLLAGAFRWRPRAKPKVSPLPKFDPVAAKALSKRDPG